jgi:4-alpha-glucanotransferase
VSRDETALWLWVAQVFALHPLYLSLRALAPEGGMPRDLAREITEASARLDLPEVDYEATLSTKLELARAMFERWGREELRVSRCSLADVLP